MLILETIDTKLYKPEQIKPMKKIPKYTCTLIFNNKALDLIWLLQIFNLPEVAFQLPDKLKNNENSPIAT